jgi:hypothetical protein
MKRDLNLIKAILLLVEETPVGKTLSCPLMIDGYEDEDVVSEHVRLLHEKCYIEAQIEFDFNSYDLRGAPPRILRYTIIRLLNDGHDFIADAKNSAVWDKTIKFIADKGGDVSLTVVKGVLTKMAWETFGLGGGN